MNGKTYRVGLVGAGYVSEFHVRALRRLPNVQIVGVTDLNQARAEATAQHLQLPAVFPSLPAMAKAGLDVVHVLTPPDSHAGVALEALGLGCHVLMEKPMATRVEDCDRVAAAANTAGRVVCVNHSLLYDYIVRRALAAVQGGLVGDVVTVDYLRSSDYPPYSGGPLPPQYRDGGYPFRDLGVHALYLLQAFLGDIRDVHGEFASRGGDPNLLYDEWRALVSCAKGSGQIQLSWNVRPLQNLLIIQGTRGVLRADLFSLTVTSKRSTPAPKAIERVFNAMNEGRQILTQVPANTLRFAFKKILPYHGLQMLVADFYRCLASGESPPVTPAEARPVVEWTERLACKADQAKEQSRQRFSGALKATTLVTGATGFIGRHLLKRLLAEGRSVRILARRQPPEELLRNPDVEVVFGDLGDPEPVERAVAGVETIFHVGGAMGGGAHDFERGSVVGTRNIVEGALRHGVAKLVHISSLSVLHAAAARPNEKVREDWPLEPDPTKRGHYSQAKTEAERIVTQAVQERGLRAIILRPGRVFGPGSPLLTQDVARQVGNRLIILGNGEQPLPLVYVEDVVDGILLAFASDRFDGSIFHLVDSERVTQNDVVRAYVDARKQSLRITHVPRFLVHTLAYGVEVLGAILSRPVPLTTYRVKSAMAPLTFDCGAAEKILGWRPQTGVRAGLARTLATG